MARSRKIKDITNLSITIIIIVLFNFIGSYFFKRFDLTSEKRYTLNPTTTTLLKNLEDGVYIKVYLEGDFNPAFTRLRNETKEILDEFRAYAKKDVNYEFINIYDEENKKDIESIQRQLYEKGLAPTELNIKTEKGNKTQIIFPGALVTYKGRETVWQIFKQQIGVAPDICINNSVQALEYELSNAIRKLDMPIKPKVAFVQGHYELDTLFSNDFHNALKEYYEVDYVALNHQLKSLDNYKAIIIAKPDSAFDDKDKFIIDQFVMKGGRALWCVDQLAINMDSLSLKGYSIGLASDKRIEDLLFTYGVRINYDLVLDLQSGQIPVNRGFKGAPNFKLYPWYYHALVMPQSKHPIVKNLDLIRFEYASSIDTVTAKKVKKTILLTTSKYAKLQPAPARINLAMTALKINEKQFNKANIPLAILCEGTFNSVFQNRLTSQIEKDSAISYKEISKPTKVIVISDGNIIRNEYLPISRTMYPVGYDRNLKQTFANKTFLLNCMNYLCDGEELLSVRAREVKLRMLDKKKIVKQSLKWKLINVGLPIALILILGIVATRLRKRAFTKKY